MKIWIGAAIVTAVLAVSGPVATAAESIKPTTQAVNSQRASDFSARRYHRRYDRRDYQPQPRYYARPYYYRPYPYSVPAPFTFGFAFGPRW